MIPIMDEMLLALRGIHNLLVAAIMVGLANVVLMVWERAKKDS